MSDRDKLVHASVTAQMTCHNIIYCLMTLGRDEHPRWKVEARLAEARQDAEKLLAAIHKAELEILNTEEVAA
jgi:hypothetical protein